MDSANPYLSDDGSRTLLAEALWNLLYILLSIVALLAFMWFLWAYATQQTANEIDTGIELEEVEVTKDTDCEVCKLASDDSYSSLSSYRCSSLSG